ncbi:hypothetical protein QYF36_020399 [Acer negundo]|nr:hypothetical protein QYF36_020399 [Acer negundo]
MRTSLTSVRGVVVQIVCKSHASELSIKRLKSYELDSTQDISLQCHIWTLHVGLVGALSFQHFGDCVDVVRLLQWITICNRLLQKAFNMKFHGLHRLELLQIDASSKLDFGRRAYAAEQQRMKNIIPNK